MWPLIQVSITFCYEYNCKNVIISVTRRHIPPPPKRRCEVLQFFLITLGSVWSYPAWACTGTRSYVMNLDWYLSTTTAFKSNFSFSTASSWLRKPASLLREAYLYFHGMRKASSAGRMYKYCRPCHYAIPLFVSSWPRIAITYSSWIGRTGISLTSPVWLTWSTALVWSWV